MPRYLSSFIKSTLSYFLIVSFLIAGAIFWAMLAWSARGMSHVTLFLTVMTTLGQIACIIALTHAYREACRHYTVDRAIYTRRSTMRAGV